MRSTPQPIHNPDECVGYFIGLVLGLFILIISFQIAKRYITDKMKLFLVVASIWLILVIFIIPKIKDAFIEDHNQHYRY